jgi:hypothetical protein
LAGEGGFKDPGALLRGAFGSLQQSAANFQDTAAVWSNLRSYVGNWWYGSQGLEPPASTSELQAKGADILHQQGVGVQDVNTYRALAGGWRTAGQNLRALEPGQQVTASSIFRPPWAVTDTAATPSEYRIRVEWNITPETGGSFTKWSSYQLTTPLSSVSDVLNQAVSLAKGDRYAGLPGLGDITAIESYEIEQI